MKTPEDVTAMARLKSLGWGAGRIAAELGCCKNKGEALASRGRLASLRTAERAVAPLRQELVAQARATPRFGTAKPYQQDDFGLRLDPADRAIAAWIARGGVDEENV